ncbi:hypothetical protein KEM54_001987 [Ascosphaera aggregata]|nr:hypothetical protein KEM54_001987 [Ascosphaera aggregata]
MSLLELPLELQIHIYRFCTSIGDVLNLSLTCHHLYHAYNSSSKLTILYNAAQHQFGPIHDIIQMITQNPSQPAPSTREAPLSISLLEQIVRAGHVAKKWEAIYPFKKWKHDYECRRYLSIDEGCACRRAVYRLWLYARSFHNSRYTRYTRRFPLVVRERARLLHNWSTAELAEMEDVRLVMRDVVKTHVCPSTATVMQKFKKRFPEGLDGRRGRLAAMQSLHPELRLENRYPSSAVRWPLGPESVSLRNGGSGYGDSGGHYHQHHQHHHHHHHQNGGGGGGGSGGDSEADDEHENGHDMEELRLFPPRQRESPFVDSYSYVPVAAAAAAAAAAATTTARSNKYTTLLNLSLYHDPEFEGWGDDVGNYYIVEDMMKLDPAQIIYLREHAPLKGQVLNYVTGLGEWFENNGETFGETFEYVVEKERGESLSEIMGGIDAGRMGVAKAMEVSDGYG